MDKCLPTDNETTMDLELYIFMYLFLQWIELLMNLQVALNLPSFLSFIFVCAWEARLSGISFLSIPFRRVNPFNNLSSWIIAQSIYFLVDYP